MVTGASSGIGKATALGLAALGAHVAITGRDVTRAAAAAADIEAAAGGVVDTFVSDLSRQSAVRRLAAEVLQSLARLDILVNSVGGYWATRHLIVDGLEHTLALNHLAPYLLTNLLLDPLREREPSRIVTVSSAAQSGGHIDFNDLQGERDYSGACAYSCFSLPTHCSPVSWPQGCQAPRSRRTRCTRAWSVPASAPITPAARSACSSRCCGPQWMVPRRTQPGP